ncbi:MAG: lysophospholipid acyltransferase family protein [Mariprofundaceae bacterium]
MAADGCGWRERFGIGLAAWLIYLIYRLLCLTVRWEYVGERYDPRATRPFVLGFWHARILMLPYMFRGWPGALLISEHRDGEMIARAAKLMGLDSVRGSSTRGGGRALLALIRLARKGLPVAVTPDGPTGPAEVVKPGVVQLARKSGLPFRSACYATERHWRLGTWDRFYVPKPFTRGVFVLGEEVWPGEDDEETLCRFQRAMDEVRQRADGYFAPEAAESSRPAA